MQDIKIDEALWASFILPEGILRRWFVVDGASVSAGDLIAEIQIEDARHEIRDGDQRDQHDQRDRLGA